MKIIALATLCMVLLPGGALSAQYDAAIFSSISTTNAHATYVTLVNTASRTLTTIWKAPGIAAGSSQRNRGGMFGPDGLIYVSLIDYNGLGALDPVTGAWPRFVGDFRNDVMGFPYQPALNFDNVGGIGFCLIDGNQPPSPPAPAASKNTVLVDFATNRYTLDGWFPNTEVDMSDFYPNLFNPGEFVGVCYYANDHTVSGYPLAQNPPEALSLTTLATVSSLHRVYYDSCWAEDGNLYLWAGSDSGIFQVDIRTGASTLLPVTGLASGMTYGCMWNEPWEKSGMIAYVLPRTDQVVYSIDLAARPLKAVATGLVIPATQGTRVNTGREAEESQLTSWWTGAGPGQRTFHLNFGQGHAGEIAILLPSATGLAANPLVLNGLEVYLAIDSISLSGLTNVLPYTPMVTLDTSGQFDVIWKGTGARLGVSAFWQAVTMKGSTFTDASNIISVNL